MQNSAGSHLWERIGEPTSASIRITCFPINANSIDTLVSIQIQRRSSIRCALAIISRSFFPEWIRWTVTDVWKFTRSERLVERARFLASIIPKTASQKLNSQVIKQYKCKYRLERPRYHRFEIFRINKQSTATSYIHLQYRSTNVLPLNRASLINQRSSRTFDRRTTLQCFFSDIQNARFRRFSRSLANFAATPIVCREFYVEPDADAVLGSESRESRSNSSLFASTCFGVDRCRTIVGRFVRFVTVNK